MARRLDDKVARDEVPPSDGKPYRIIYDGSHDGAVKGFGLRITKAGARSWVLNYRAKGVERRLTIGSFPDWKAAPARTRAGDLKREIDNGGDPMGERHADRAAPTVADLAARYLTEHAGRKRTGAADKAAIDSIILPKLGNRRVVDLRHVDIADLHRSISEHAPIRANRLLALLSKMLSLAVRWEMRLDNPAKGLERNQENRRTRYLTMDELTRLTRALAEHKRRSSADAVRLLMLTGARRGEVLAATWDQFNIAAGSWSKPASSTKTKREHTIPLSGMVRVLLAEMREKEEEAARKEGRAPQSALFPGRGKNETQADLKNFWRTVTKNAGIAGLRLHDLRHSYASFLASSGLSLPIIGGLLGHTSAQTTQRYAHLLDDPLRLATERMSAIVGAAQSGKTAEVTDMTGKRA
jgi:integrase